MPNENENGFLPEVPCHNFHFFADADIPGEQESEPETFPALISWVPLSKANRAEDESIEERYYVTEPPA